MENIITAYAYCFRILISGQYDKFNLMLIDLICLPFDCDSIVGTWDCVSAPDLF